MFAGTFYKTCSGRCFGTSEDLGREAYPPIILGRRLKKGFKMYRMQLDLTKLLTTVWGAFVLLRYGRQ